MKQIVVILESVNKTNNPNDILVIARSPQGQILNVDTPEAIAAWYLGVVRPVENSNNVECVDKSADVK